MTITETQINTMMTNIMVAFYDDNIPINVVNMPRIAPGNPDGSIWGKRDDAIAMGPWWMMADMLRLMAEHCRAFPSDQQMVTRVHQQAAFLAASYSEAQLQSDGFNSDGSPDGTIYSSDDAAWKIQSFCDLHRVTKDAAWLYRAQIALPKCLNRFKDPNHAQVNAGDGILWSPYGILYAGTDNPGQPQNISSSIETGMVQAALYIHEQTGIQGFLNYALGMGQRWIKPSSAADPGFQGTGTNQGAFFVEMGLNPVAPVYRQPPPTAADGTQPPFRNGGSTYMIQASMGVGVVCAKLYRITKDASWLTPIQQIIGALASTSVYLVSAGKFLDDRDPYSVGFFACDFVRDVLSLHAEGIDAGNVVRTGFVTTGQYILSNPLQGTAPDTNVYYSADWGIPADDVRNGYSTTGYRSWTDAGAANPGQQAVPQQITTTSMSGMMALAGYLCGTLTGATLTDGGSILTDNGQTLVDA